MRKYFNITAAVALAFLCLFSCKKKSDSISPTYKANAPGTASNPYPGNNVITSTVNVVDPPTKNSSIIIGGAGWSNPSCISTNSMYLVSVNDPTQVTLNFYTPPAMGTYTYNVASTPGVGAVSMVVKNAPDQPSGIIWYGRSGVVSVSTSSSAVTAVITGTGVSCIQSTFGFPQVIVTGALGCN